MKPSLSPLAPNCSFDLALRGGLKWQLYYYHSAQRYLTLALATNNTTIELPRQPPDNHSAVVTLLRRSRSPRSLLATPSDLPHFNTECGIRMQLHPIPMLPAHCLQWGTHHYLSSCLCLKAPITSLLRCNSTTLDFQQGSKHCHGYPLPKSSPTSALPPLS